MYGTCCLCPTYLHRAPLPTVLHAMDALNVPPPSPAQSSGALFLAGSHQFLCNSIISIEPGQALILKAVTPSNFIQPGGVWTMDYDSPLHCPECPAQPRSDCFPKHWPFVLSLAGAGAGQRGHYGQVAPTLHQHSQAPQPRLGGVNKNHRLAVVAALCLLFIISHNIMNGSTVSLCRSG